ncbi:MAG: DivIVA domain-containing protein, partial [Selenomonadaceae bacterium]|nr:DivIVA domain-containing protein [Selenomonadaceae bacterium]
MLTPMEIHDHQFKKSFRGYSENEVDDFLDKIVEDFEKLLRENERLKNQLNNCERELDHYRKLEKTLNDTLMVAQRTADEVITAAKKNADELKENAARECQTLRENARLEARQQIESASTKRDAILAEYDSFVREKNSFLMKLRTILESELNMTVQMLEDIPKVSEAVKTVLPVEENIPVPAQETDSIRSEELGVRSSDNQLHTQLHTPHSK